MARQTVATRFCPFRLAFRVYLFMAIVIFNVCFATFFFSSFQIATYLLLMHLAQKDCFEILRDFLCKDLCDYVYR